MNRQKVKRVIVSTTIGVVLLVICSYAFWWRPGNERARCSLHLRNYNTAIASCGMDLSADEAWKDPKATERLVEKLFEKKIPKCPSGGEYSIIYGEEPHPRLPKLVCSLAESRDHKEAP